MLEENEFIVNKEFIKTFKQRLKDKGLILTTAESELVFKCLLDTIVKDYVFKFKKLTLQNFGTFEGVIMKMKSSYLVSKGNESLTFPKMKFIQSKHFKNEFKRRYKALSEKSNDKG